VDTLARAAWGRPSPTPHERFLYFTAAAAGGAGLRDQSTVAWIGVSVWMPANLPRLRIAYQ